MNVLELIGTANDWERFLVLAPTDGVLHMTGIDCWTAANIVSYLAAFTLTRLWKY